jgi:hypothetical protein
VAEILARHSVANALVHGGTSWKKQEWDAVVHTSAVPGLRAPQ